MIAYKLRQTNLIEPLNRMEIPRNFVRTYGNSSVFAQNKRQFGAASPLSIRKWNSANFNFTDSCPGRFPVYVIANTRTSAMQNLFWSASYCQTPDVQIETLTLTLCLWLLSRASSVLSAWIWADRSRSVSISVSARWRVVKSINLRGRGTRGLIYTRIMTRCHRLPSGNETGDGAKVCLVWRPDSFAISTLISVKLETTAAG